MRRVCFLASALALTLGILLGCQEDDPVLPSEPSAIEVAGQGDCAPEALIAALFPKGLAIAALEQCQNIQRQYVSGEKAEAFDQLVELIAFTVEHLANGQLVDPDGSGLLTEESGAAQLIVQLHMIVGLADGTEAVPTGALTDDGGTVAMVDAEEGWDITTPDGFAAVTKAAGVPVFLNDAPYTGPVTVFIAPVDPAETSFSDFGLQVGGSDRGAFPLFKEMGTIPDGLRFGDGEIDPENPDPLNELVVELCIVDPPHPLAPFPEQLPDLRLGHILDGQTLEVAPLRSSSLDCDGVNDEVPTALMGNWWHGLANTVFAPVAEILDVAKLYARPGRLGGAISAFSEFGGVDQTQVASPPPDPRLDGINWAEGFSVEVMAEVPSPWGLAYPAVGSDFGMDLYIASHGQDQVFRVSESGGASVFVDLLEEADPVALEFPPAPSGSFGDFLYVTSNNRDGNRAGDLGGTIQRVGPDGQVTDFTSVGLVFGGASGTEVIEGLGEPSGRMAFGPSGAFGDGLWVANLSDVPGDVIKVDPDGTTSVHWSDGKTSGSPVDGDIGAESIAVAFGRGGGFGLDLYVSDASTGCSCIRISDFSGDTVTVFLELSGQPTALEFGRGDPAFGEDLYVAVRASAGFQILRMAADGTSGVLLESETGFVAGDGLAFSPDGEALLIADREGGLVLRVEGASP